MADPKAVMLRSVHTRATKLSEHETAFHTAIYGAHIEGASLREIAEAAGLSHTQIANIVKAEKAARAEA